MLHRPGRGWGSMIDIPWLLNQVLLLETNIICFFYHSNGSSRVFQLKHTLRIRYLVTRMWAAKVISSRFFVVMALINFLSFSIFRSVMLVLSSFAGHLFKINPRGKYTSFIGI